MKRAIHNTTARAAALLMLAAGCGPAAAQLHESISVEGKYVPEIIPAQRLNIFPSALSPRLGSFEMDYERGGVPASFRPRALAMPATGWNATRDVSTRRGYLDLGAGSWLNSTLSAGYRFIDNATTLAGVRLQHNSSSLWKPELDVNTAGVKRWLYDENIGVYATHVFRGVGRLDASIDYHIGNFNYYGYLAPFPTEAEGAPAQTLNDLSLRLGWRSTLRSTASLQYHAELGLRHFGYREMHALTHTSEIASLPGLRETDFQVKAGIALPWGNGSTAGLDARFDALGYSGLEGDGRSYPSSQWDLACPDGYGMLTLTPYYSFRRGQMDIRVGADIDLSFNAGPSESRYSLFHIAPDVNFDLRTGPVGLYLHLRGGSELQTLASLWQLDYYQMPGLATTRPVYTPLDARLGVDFGPFSGVSLSASVAWKSSDRIPLRGWYMSMLGYGFEDVPGLDRPEGVSVYSMDPYGLSVRGFSLSASAAYEPGRIGSLKASVSYQNQNGRKGYFNGYDRPRWILDVEGSLNPVKPLTLTVGYGYRGVRNIYAHCYVPVQGGGTAIDGDGSSRPHLASLRLPDLTLLNLSARWSFTDDFSVWIRADNLLNRHDAVLPMQPSEGVSVTGGVSWLF